MKLSSQIKSAVTKLIKAEEADSFKGMGDPEDYPDIERRLELAHEHLNRLLRQVDELEGKHVP